MVLIKRNKLLTIKNLTKMETMIIILSICLFVSGIINLKYLAQNQDFEVENQELRNEIKRLEKENENLLNNIKNLLHRFHQNRIV